GRALERVAQRGRRQAVRKGVLAARENRRDVSRRAEERGIDRESSSRSGQHARSHRRQGAETRPDRIRYRGRRAGRTRRHRRYGQCERGKRKGQKDEEELFRRSAAVDAADPSLYRSAFAKRSAKKCQRRRSDPQPQEREKGKKR